MMRKVYMDTKGIAMFVCPQCGKAKTADVSKYKNSNTAIKIKMKCSCGHFDTCILERRDFYRKEVNLAGVYTRLLEDKLTDKGLMTVKDLSQNGIKMKLNVKRDLKLYDKFFVEFNLDDRRRFLIQKKLVVKNINDFDIGARFIDIDTNDAYNRAIKFYLFK